MFASHLRRAIPVLTIACLLSPLRPAAAACLCGSPGDGNGDCRISLEDHADFTACQSGPGTPVAAECLCYDMDGDSDVDLADAQQFQRQFTGDALIAACVLPVRESEPGTLRPRKRGGPGKATWGVPDSTVNESVYLFSGEFHLTETDLVVRGRGFDFEWTRRYRSRSGSTSPMGAGWSHNYDIRLEQSGGNLILHDGDGRSDEYCPGPGGTWTHPEFFREIVQVPGGYVMTAHDRATWEFHDFAGLPTDGKLSSMHDRNGNSMTFDYDPVLGRLSVIHDTLETAVNARTITLAYNADGLIESITDFTGRQVTYAYYQDADVGGDAGDLRSVTTPAVVNTPNGNDFPQGKTTVYTYSEGSADPQLNHNLLTITDPKGQTYLENTYATTLNPADPAYDRLISQRCGLPNEEFFFFYQSLSPTPANNFATRMCIVNDRVGNVEECLYDYRNRLAVRRRYSGRANPNAVTTDVQNRPVNPLRANDPPFFETRYSYNDESLLTRVVAPEGDELLLSYRGDLSPTEPQRKRAELLAVTHLPGPRGGTQQAITEQFEYDDAANSNTSQPTAYVDGRGERTTFEYDAAGNHTRTVAPIPSIIEDFEYNAFGQMTRQIAPDNGSGSRQETEFLFYLPADGHLNGYLKQTVVDVPGFALTTTYDYDSVGNMTRVVDPQGNATDYVYNALDQVVQSLSPEVAPGVGPRYETLTYYDANNNIVQVDTENRDAQGVLDPNAYLTTDYEYDILNCVTRSIDEVDTLNNVVTEYDYDANRNRTQVRLGEATNGNQPANTVSYVYDERDLLFRTTRGAGAPEASTTQYDYDANGNLTLDLQGLQSPDPRETTYEYDGYNRLTLEGRNFGNESRRTYDENGNVVRELEFGELLDVPGSAGNVRLADTRFVYDPINRLTIHGAQFFDAAQNPLTDGESTTTYSYSDSSHLLHVTDDNGHSSSCVYDTANRRDVCTDAKGNTVRYTYDANSNIIAEEATDKSDIGLPDEVFTDTYDYDGLNRLTLHGDNFGNTRVTHHDSRDLVGQEVDALGNTSTYTYDGLDRLIESTRVLTDTGAGGGMVVGAIVNTQVWDNSSRLVQQIDGNGNATTYSYDPLNRLLQTHFADGTNASYAYDVHDNKTQHTDANGTQITYDYDSQNRLTLKGITPGPGVSNDTTFEAYTYDGLDRLVRAEDDDAIVTRAYDSLSNLTQETLNGVATTSTYDGLGNQIQCVYPNGRTIDRLYDPLDRVTTIADAGATIADFLYVGPDRKQLRLLGNGSQTMYTYNGVTGVPNRPGDFGVRQPGLIDHSHPVHGPIDVREYHWDPMYNRTFRYDPVRLVEHNYEYDSMYRLTRTVVNDTTPPAPTLLRDTQYTLDDVGNRNQVLGDNCPGAYTLDPASPPADFQMNQYTATGCDDRMYDSNGNWTDRSSLAPNAQMVYDYKDRLVQHDDLIQRTTTVMAYDALGRRISQSVSSGVPVSYREYFYDGADVILEQDGAGNVTTYVHGDDIDEVVQMQRGAGDYYYHADDLGTVLALTDSNGVVVERYAYQDYGAPEFFDGAGNPLPASLADNPYLFTGRRYDASTGLYYYRHRYLDPVAGRFTSRDPLGGWHDEMNTGNAYTYAGSNPWTYADPLGLMNKAELVEALASSSGKALKKGDRIALVGFGSFSISKRAARTGRNPQTGKEIKIAAKNVVKFKAGADLSKKVNIAGGGNGCPMDAPVKCWDGSCRTSVSACPNADVVSGVEYAGAGLAAARGRHRGHVTVLKAHDSAPAQDYNSSRSNNGSIVAPPPGGGDGGMGRSADDKKKKHKHRGHVTILKLSGTDPHSGKLTGLRQHASLADPGHGPGSGRSTGKRIHHALISAGDGTGHCGRCGAMLCRCKDIPMRGPGGRRHTHRGHVTVLKLHGTAGGGGGGGGTTSANTVAEWVMQGQDGGDVRSSPGDGKKKKHKHRGHVTILK